VVRLKHVPESGRLPLGIQEIQHMMLGCIVARSRNLQKGLDSYQVCHALAINTIAKMPGNGHTTFTK